MNTNEVAEKPKKKNIINHMILFLKSHKRLKFAAVTILVVIVIAITVVTILHSVQAEKIAQAQIGRCYLVNTDSDTTAVRYYQEDGYSFLYVSYEDETRQKVDYMDGSLSEIDGEYAFKISLFGTPHLYHNHYDDGPIVLGEAYQIMNRRRDEWKLISLEEALAFEKESNRLYAMTLCKHQFGPAEVIKAASCSEHGEEKVICKICNYQQINKTKLLSHDYVNKICSVCGEKKPVEKSDITPNTWYTYNDMLYFQNIKLTYAFPVSKGKGMMVSYYFVCQHCHSVDSELLLSVPEFNYAIKKICTCDECNKTTTVRIELG